MLLNLLYVLAGVVGGLIAGLTGLGTGIVMLGVIPIMLMQYGVPESQIVSVIIANTIFATLVSSFANVITTMRQKMFFWKETLWVGVFAVICSFLVFEWIVGSTFYSKTVFNSIIIGFMLIIILQTFRKLKLSSAEKEHVTPVKLTLTGILGGTIAGFTGLGGGTVLIPLLNIWQKVDIKKAKSISFGVIFLIALWLTLYNMFFGDTLAVAGSQGLIIFPLVLPLAIGVLIGSPLGVVISHRMSSRAVTIVFLIMVSIVTIQKILDLAGLN
ncbi:MAG: sulfite exporter TauE/SafE family protein [Cyclobacteriaceae bacterium]|nr:sulfite exporter TauE/SafE family protein [Cyclobacteriaceae bacterium]